MTSFLTPLDNLNSTKRNTQLFYPTRTECITTQSSFARMSPTSSYGSNMPSPTSVLHHQQQQQSSYGMQFLPPPPPFFVQACYPTTSSNEYPPTYFRPIPTAVNSAPQYSTQPPPLMQINPQQQQQTYKPTNAIPQLMDFNPGTINQQQMHSPPARCNSNGQYHHHQSGNQQQQHSKARPQHQQTYNNINNKNNRYQQSISPTFSTCSSNKSLEDESEPVLLTRSHSVPDATNDSSYTLATLFRNKIFVGSLTQSITAGDLVEFFQKFGTVTEAKVVIDDKGSPRGYGFVTFGDAQAVRKILTAGSIFICGQRVAVASAIRKKHPDDL